MRNLVKSSGITLFAIVSFLLLVQGCVSTQEIMNSWLGHHQSDLIASWGPPTRTASDGKGGSILIYEQFVDLGQSPGEVRWDWGKDFWGKDSGGITYKEPQQHGYVRTRMFYVNERGYIYHWLVK